MKEKKIFKDFTELGGFLKKKRRETGERIHAISSKLLIKKDILKRMEEGLFTQDDYYKNSYLKGFLKTYMKEIQALNLCDIENLFSKDLVAIKKTNVSIDNNKEKKTKYGSLIILVSLSLVGLLYLFWTKTAYYNLYELEKFLN